MRSFFAIILLKLTLLSVAHAALWEYPISDLSILDIEAGLDAHIQSNKAMRSVDTENVAQLDVMAQDIAVFFLEAGNAAILNEMKSYPAKRHTYFTTDFDSGSSVTPPDQINDLSASRVGFVGRVGDWMRYYHHLSQLGRPDYISWGRGDTIQFLYALVFFTAFILGFKLRWYSPRGKRMRVRRAAAD